MKEEKKLNQFKNAVSKEDYTTFDKDLPMSGFYNDFWASEFKQPGQSVSTRYLWTIKKKNPTTDTPDDGIFNCDSDFDRDMSDKLYSLHQVYFQTLLPELEDLEKRADKYDLWPK